MMSDASRNASVLVTLPPTNTQSGLSMLKAWNAESRLARWRLPPVTRMLLSPNVKQSRATASALHVEDVAEAVARALQGTETHAITYECGGPRVYSYEEFLRAVAHEAGLKPMLIPIPFAAWHALAWISEMLPSPPVTRNQVELMQVDNVSSPEMPGFGQLGISPHCVEEILQQMLWSR
jgi:NADH dehydrogenase